MVSPIGKNAYSYTFYFTQVTEDPDPSSQRGNPPAREHEVDGLLPIRQRLKDSNLSERTIEIILSAWRGATKRQYVTYIKKWMDFCSEKRINYMHPTIEEVLNFLTYCFDQLKLGYSAINTVRSALSAFLIVEQHPVGTHPLVVKFVKGVFQSKPALPKNRVTWYVAIVLEYFRKLGPVAKLTLKQLTLKTATLTALLTGQRAQSLFLMNIKAYAPDRRLCLLFTLREYINRTASLRGQVKGLFITTVKPHHAASRQTISKWIKTMLAEAGIDMHRFTPHSTRSASTSAVSAKNVPIDTILRTAGWTNARTFANYYHKQVSGVGLFAEAILGMGPNKVPHMEQPTSDTD